MEGTALRSLTIARLDGEVLVVDGLGLARAFFTGDPSSVGMGAYDSLSGREPLDRITTDDIRAINTTMRARSPHIAWEPILNRRLAWLADIAPTLDLIAADDAAWRKAEGERLVTVALTETVGVRRGPSVATKVLHLKRPRLFPVLDNFVAVMLGVNVPADATAEGKVRVAMELLLHLREEGRRNLEQLLSIQSVLREGGIDRPLVRILDAIVWFSHPAAGVRSTRREIRVNVITEHERDVPVADKPDPS